MLLVEHEVLQNKQQIKNDCDKGKAKLRDIEEGIVFAHVVVHLFEEVHQHLQQRKQSSSQVQKHVPNAPAEGAFLLVIKYSCGQYLMKEMRTFQYPRNAMALNSSQVRILNTY